MNHRPIQLRDRTGDDYDGIPHGLEDDATIVSLTKVEFYVVSALAVAFWFGLGTAFGYMLPH